MSDSKTGSGSGGGGKYRYLTADIGGTNSRLQLHEILEFGSGDGDGWRENLLFEHVYPSAPASHLNAIILQFLNEKCKSKRDTPEWPQSACLAVAGPVKNNQCLITNLAVRHIPSHHPSHHPPPTTPFHPDLDLSCFM